jgi:hypothetical protein
MYGPPYPGQGGSPGGFHVAELAAHLAAAGCEMIRVPSLWLRNADLTVFLGSLAVLDSFRVYSDKQLAAANNDHLGLSYA